MVADLWHAEGLTGADVPVPCGVLDFEEITRGLDRVGVDGLRGITSLQDVGLVPAAELAAARGLPGPSVAGARAARDKVRQRELLAAAGIRVPRWWTVPDAATLAGLLDTHGPLVVKPPTGTASLGVRLVTSAAEAAAGYAHAAGFAAGATVLVEEYVEGAEYSVETISAAGHHRVAACTRKLSGALPYFVETGHSTEVDEVTAGRLGAVATAALTTIGFDHGVAHVELRIGADGPTVIEVNGRVAGDLIPMLHRLTGRADLHDAVVALALGEPIPDFGVPRGSATIRFLDAGEVRAVRARLAADGPPAELWTVSLPKDPEDGPITWSGHRAGYVVLYDRFGAGAERAAEDLVGGRVSAPA